MSETWIFQNGTGLINLISGDNKRNRRVRNLDTSKWY